MAKKYASLTTLQNLVDNIKALFVKKTDLETTLSGYDTKGSAAAVQENLDTVSDTLDAHTTNSDIHFTAAERTKLSGIAAGAQVNTVTGVKGNSESTYRTGNINITKANIGLGNVDNTADSAKSVKYATSAGSATSATKATQDAGGNVITTTYETKSDATSKLTEAKTYADNAATTAANTVKNDLLNNAGAAYDTLKELGDLIDDNKDAIDALNDVAAGKANAVHTHAISDVSGLQSALDGKAASSHGTHVSFDSTNKPKMDGTAAFGTSSKVARADHVHPTDTSRAAKTDLDSHTANTTAHITATERTNWNAAKTHADSAHAPSNAQPNQNAFSNIKVGTTTIAADTTTDTLELVGSNVTITPDATNDKVTIAVADGSTSAKGVVQLTDSVTSTSTTTAATPKNVKAAYDLANTAKTTADGKANASHTHTVANITDLTATATELNYMDGVISNVQAQIDSKSDSSHTHTGLSYIANVTSDVQTQLNAKSSATNIKNGTGTKSLLANGATTASGQYSMAEGQSTTASGDSSHAEGYKSVASGSYSHAEGRQTNAVGKYSHSEGYGTSTTIKLTGDASATTYTVSAANSEIRIGRVLQYGTTYAKITAYDSSALTVTVSPTLSSSALSSASVTLHRGISYGQESHSEGYYTTASSEAAHAEGYHTIASGTRSHAEGSYTNATGYYSHAEGESTTASHSSSHAEGNATIASGGASHAEGSNTTASGTNSHAQGYRATASGSYAHAEGGVTVASGSGSHAEGYGTIAKGESQHVQGEYNIEDTSNKYAHIVGNGSSSARSNAHTLDWDGNAWFKGNIYTGGTSQSSGATMLASVSTMTTAEYNALEATNANTLYILTDAEEEEEVLITVDDIDAICGATV